MKVRRVRVDFWNGPPPAVGDRLRGLRGRWLITRIQWWEPGRARALYLMRVDQGTIEGGREHPWSWSRRRGRARAR